MVNGPKWQFFTRISCTGTKWESFETEMLGCTTSGELHSMRDEDFTASRLFYAFTFVVASSFTLDGGGFLISSRARLTMSTCGDLVERMTEEGGELANRDTSSSSSFSNSFTERGTHGVLGGECFGS